MSCNVNELSISGKRNLDNDNIEFDIGFSSMIVDPTDSTLLHGTEGKILDTNTGRWTALYYDEVCIATLLDLTLRILLTKQ